MAVLLLSGNVSRQERAQYNAEDRRPNCTGGLMRSPESHPLFRLMLAVIVLLALCAWPAIDAEVDAKLRALEGRTTTAHR